jgi:hypothetical protein
LLMGWKLKNNCLQLVNTFAILVTSLSPLETPQVVGFD